MQEGIPEMNALISIGYDGRLYPTFVGTYNM